VLDIPELLKYYTAVRRHQIPDVDDEAREQKTQHLVLIADDSTLLRKSLEQTLTHANYKTVEASDGLEALDKLTQNPPDIFLLDMEMPNLNGYDLLSIMSVYPELMDVKVIMLTSRTTEKHKQHALDLGAHAFLAKPCPQDVLLQTIAGLL
jgi:chemosensory pili system protein ChpA (sensor histidine kinase/response regulator)